MVGCCRDGQCSFYLYYYDENIECVYDKIGVNLLFGVLGQLVMCECIEDYGGGDYQDYWGWDLG